MTAINSRLSRLRSPFGSARIPPAVRMRSWKSYRRESRGESGKEELYETAPFHPRRKSASSRRRAFNLIRTLGSLVDSARRCSECSYRLRFQPAGCCRQRWAFLAGMRLYQADLIALIAMFSLTEFGCRAFVILKFF